MIEIEHFVKDYQDFHLEISMCIPDNKVVGIIGRNGCGKSTTIKAILGLIRPTSGSVRVFGKETRMLQPRDKERIGAALSDSMFSSQLTVEDIIAVLRAMYRDFDEPFFREMCGKLALPLKKQLKDFSTGMKVKVKVLTAISHKAALLILDEPTSGLDVEARTEIIRTIKDYVASNDCSVLITSHISSDLEGLCDEFYLFAGGRILLHETEENIGNRYGTVQIPFELFDSIDRSLVSSCKKETFGFACVINDKESFAANYPELKVKPANIDDLILLLGGDEG
ncbi:MAG: ABC transporter ATP-binding protein [Lentisphaeria bacterium]|nr:ABC transporter ATP-binding protein [Lentisphaeria bacterium]